MSASEVMASEFEAAAERWGRGLYNVGDGKLLADWAVTRLAADRAEREERARPIDAEWCEANGGERLCDGKTWRWLFRAGRVVDVGRIEWDAKNGVVAASPGGRWAFLQVANCGDFGDLLRVLKGGAE